jgi:crossover junction endodeoxyribonuclease RuvC
MLIGIDPGKTGGLALLDTDHAQIIALHVMPETLADLADLMRELSRHTRLTCFVEQVHAMPKQGVTSVFTFGQGYGALMGMLTVLKIPFVLVRPQKWQKEFWGKTTNPKASAYEAARRLYPEASLLATERSKKPHEGLIDALLIARYGWNMTRGKV